MTSFLNQSSFVGGGGGGAGGGGALDDIDTAATLVDYSVVADRNYVDLSDLLQVPRHTTPSCSGQLDFDYPSLADPKIGLASLTELGGVRHVRLPEELVEQFGRMQCNCMMGLFPEISRAWLSIDSRIFVWNYEDGTDLAYFDGLSETILCAGLVLPKPGIFQPHIQYLLCLATPIDIVLLGVSFAKPFEGGIGDSGGAMAGFGEMHLLPEPLFSIPTDNVMVCSVKGSDNGRIFMAGKDGYLYELVYQAEDGWFSRKCRKVNHSTSKLSYLVPSFLNFSFVEDDALVQIDIDSSRNILYTRSEKGTIQVFDLGEDGRSMSRVAAVSLQTTVQNAVLVAKSIDRSMLKPLIHIAAIERGESTNVHLVAVTYTGVRLYFTTHNFNYPAGRPSMLSLLHVRLPPGFSASAAPIRPTKVHAAHYSKGTLLLAAEQSEDNDLLWTISSDAFPFQKQLRETHETTPIDGHSWAVAEIPMGCTRGFIDEQTVGSGRAQPPLVVTQHMEADRRFVIINSQGSYLLSKLHPVDQLRKLLLDSGSDSDQVASFFKLHKEQACASCLILATSVHLTDQPVRELARRAFFMYGGEPEYNYNAAGLAQVTNIGPLSTTALGGSSMLAPPTFPMAAGTGPASTTFGTPNPASAAGQQMSTPFPHVQPQQLSFHSPTSTLAPLASPTAVGSGVANTTGYGLGAYGTSTVNEVLFSAKHDGLSLYVARLLRPVWEPQMVVEVPVAGKNKFLSCRWSSAEISFILNKLLALKDFMTRNSQFSSALAAESYAAAHGSRASARVGDQGMDEHTRRKYQAHADRQEMMSLQHLEHLVSRCCENLALWGILCDHQFHVIAAALTKDQQNALRNMNFRMLVTNGKELSSALIVNLINMYIDDNAATDAISLRLREVCPNLYSSEDETCSKGSEKLQNAKAAQTPAEREKNLSEALKLFKEISVHLDLPQVCTQFGAVRYYSGIVDLALTAAARRDPQGLALHYYKNGQPPEDQQGYTGYIERIDCYKCITETLDYLLSTSQSHPQAPSVPKSPGPPPPQDPNLLTNTEAAKHAEDVLELALRSDDEMFHVALYDWLIQKQLSEKLLEIQSPYLEPYLKLGASQRADNLAMLDLLWKYYEKGRSFAAAAKILSKLADRRTAELSLAQRVEYLSRATMCAKSCSTGGQRIAITANLAQGALPEHGEFLHELEEKMEVARLQMNILDVLKTWSNPDVEIQDALQKLNAELMDITTLYGEFADRFELSECKLAIIHCAGHYDPTLVESLWQSIINKELEMTYDRDAKSRMKILSDKFISLGRMYGASDKYFPVAFLLKLLEQVSCEMDFINVNRKFVFTTLQEIGITVPKLHEYYDRLFKSKDSCWKSLRQPFHLLYVIHLLLETFADSPNVVPAYERRAFSTLCLDSVANYLVELQAESNMSADVRTLNASFKDLQAKLERLL